MKALKLTAAALLFMLQSHLTLADNVMGPFTTKDGDIINANKEIMTFKGVSWFGFNTETYVLHGLWQKDFSAMLQQMKQLGLNAVRIPFQFNFVLDATIKPNGINTNCNGPNSCNTAIPKESAFAALKWVVEQFTQHGIYVLLDDHYEDNTYVSNYPAWLQGWQKIAETFQDNHLVGYDLYNEPDSHGLTWEGNDKVAWGKAILDATDIIYRIDPTKLIFIEGTAQGKLEANWGDGFATDQQTISQGISNPKAFFAELITKPYLNQIVISPHVYGPDGTNGQGQDHSNPQKAFQIWSRLFGYLNHNFSKINDTTLSGFCTADKQCHQFPIVIGEFGGKFDPADPYYSQDTATNTNIAAFIKLLSPRSSWFYWSWNPNSGNTGGLLQNDWQTLDMNKVNFLRDNLQL